MPLIKNVVFKKLTASDFYWINQPGLAKGGGQSYIDFDTSEISREDWRNFFEGATEGNGAQGPYWLFSVRNLGSNTIQTNVKIGQRRATSFSIRSQKLPKHSAGGKRLHAWSPHYTDFPALPDNTDGASNVSKAPISNLRIFLARDDSGTFWAGWWNGPAPASLPTALQKMFDVDQGIINIGGKVELDPAKPDWPFAEAIASEGPSWDDDDEASDEDTDIEYSLKKVRKRNKAAADGVRKLYTTCQVSGTQFLFKTKSGKPYLEVHHLIPLGKGGADCPHNMVVVCPQIHKMLHHAEVDDFDLSNIVDNELPITIAEEDYTITWHPQHATKVLEHNLS